ncbi:hypothetical protein CAOG_02613 [Capsaspora owczarzaki ATCC 30864]|uniref:RING-type domain-containing protein n=1 Tax=Capsaspora owczarzaki (strain ATCC 30864) TaxID=595528 RepID=A0A0D2X1V8_CAPO3|nr:hypothetical protein CAOG_02613 [Capsaspora owczarzaki ATCC 30864]KJE91484.1 hypothetical protein CAOG_002613 [Capsaspora owczarzaki ATCC 30864]|eukprot:XP_004349363.1 hypothetical protein CAOG_02613 [Capsaspora owczarzaki ATCC 30864]
MRASASRPSAVLGVAAPLLLLLLLVLVLGTPRHVGGSPSFPLGSDTTPIDRMPAAEDGLLGMHKDVSTVPQRRDAAAGMNAGGNWRLVRNRVITSAQNGAVPQHQGDHADLTAAMSDSRRVLHEDTWQALLPLGLARRSLLKDTLKSEKHRRDDGSPSRTPVDGKISIKATNTSTAASLSATVVYSTLGTLRSIAGAKFLVAVPETGCPAINRSDLALAPNEGWVALVSTCPVTDGDNCTYADKAMAAEAAGALAAVFSNCDSAASAPVRITGETIVAIPVVSISGVTTTALDQLLSNNPGAVWRADVAPNQSDDDDDLGLGATLLVYLAIVVLAVCIPGFAVGCIYCIFRRQFMSQRAAQGVDPYFSVIVPSAALKRAIDDLPMFRVCSDPSLDSGIGDDDARCPRNVETPATHLGASKSLPMSAMPPSALVHAVSEPVAPNTHAAVAVPSSQQAAVTAATNNPRQERLQFTYVAPEAAAASALPGSRRFSLKRLRRKLRMLVLRNSETSAQPPDADAEAHVTPRNVQAPPAGESAAIEMTDIVVSAPSAPSAAGPPPSFTRPLNETCAVCLDDFEAGDLGLLLPCHHGYHPECIREWLLQHGSCPLCKAWLLPATADETIASDYDIGAHHQPGAATAESQPAPGPVASNMPASRRSTISRHSASSADTFHSASEGSHDAHTDHTTL